MKKHFVLIACLLLLLAVSAQSATDDRCGKLGCFETPQGMALDPVFQLSINCNHGDRQACDRLHSLATSGNADAQSTLAGMYYFGDNFPKDYVQAVQWYQKAADQGLVGAQFRLGQMHENGQGIPKDYVQAVQWYRKAADQGLAEAQVGLGYMYENGLGGLPKSHAQAVQWYQKAADQGNFRAKALLRKERK